jgi:predicted histone-like DNA-binding protein
MIKYKAMQRKSPKNGRVAWYAAVDNEKNVGIDQIVDAIQAECTVHRADVLAVLATLEEQVISNLQAGNSVRLGQLGSFHVTLKSRPSEAEDEVTSENIKAVMVRFRKSRRMQGQFQLTNPALRFLGPRRAPAAEPGD